MTIKIIDVLDPTARAIDMKAQIALRVRDLNGRVIGFLNNGKANADVFLARVEELLCQRYTFAEIIRVTKGPIGGAFAYSTDLSEKLTAKCNIVVNGIGD